MPIDKHWLNRGRNRIVVVHYACSSFTKSPLEISCIAIKEFVTKKTDTFARSELSEKELLSRFYAYVEKNSEKIYVGWNFKDTTYGLPVLERRYRDLFGSDPPKIREDVDLDGVIKEEYGGHYVDDGRFGKLWSLMALNGISMEFFRPGKEEARLYVEKKFPEIEKSTNCKVRGIANILDLFLNSKLKIQFKGNIENMDISIVKNTAIGGIGSAFGRKYGSRSVDRILNTYDITDIPPKFDKGEKIAHVLRKLINSPTLFSNFMTELLNLHKRSLSEGDISMLNSNLKILGYQIKDDTVSIALGGTVTYPAISPDLTDELRRMANAYITLYRLENQLRAFIKEKMEKVHGPEWWKNKVTSKIQGKCKRRKEVEEKSKWHEVKEAHPLWYTTFEEIQHIIQKNWDVFNEHFGKQQGIISRLFELEIPRNTIAHNRILEMSEFERLNMFSRDIQKIIKSKKRSES